MSDLIPVHVRWLRAGGRSEKTYNARERVLLRADEALQPYGLDNAHTDEIAAYFERDDWSAWTKHSYWRHMNSFYDWGVDRGDFALNPMDSLIRPDEGDRLPDPLTDEALALAVDSFPLQPMGMAVRLAAYAGLRCCEIVTVRREDCTERDLRVRGKGGQVRVIDMSPVLWADVRDRPRGHLCVGVRGRPLAAKTLSQMQTSFWRQIGLPDDHLHKGRHWFGTTLVANGVPLPTVQVLMGHRSIQSTVNYTLVVSAQRAAAVKLLPSLLGSSCNAAVARDDAYGEGTSRSVAGSCPPAAEAA